MSKKSQHIGSMYRAAAESKGRDTSVSVDSGDKGKEELSLSSSQVRLRIIATIFFLLLGTGAIAFGVASFFSAEAGWAQIEADSTEYNCADEFVFYYDLGRNNASASSEKKALVALYTDAVEHAFAAFSVDVAYEDTNNLYYLNRHPNEVVEVDDLIYQALLTLDDAGVRNAYLGPAYEYYKNLFMADDDGTALQFDPNANDETAAYFAEVAAFAADPESVWIEFLGDDRLCLHVSDEYAAFLLANEVEDVLDLYWMKNAFIADYLAETIRDAGYTAGMIASVDGFVVSTDESDTTYSQNVFSMVEGALYPVATLSVQGPTALVYLRSYPMSSSNFEYWHVYATGEIALPYLDLADGKWRSAASELVCYSHTGSCAELLCKILGTWIADDLDEGALERLAGEGVNWLFVDGQRVCVSSEDVVVTDLYSDENMTFSLEVLDR